MELTEIHIDVEKCDNGYIIGYNAAYKNKPIRCVFEDKEDARKAINEFFDLLGKDINLDE